MTFEIRPQTAQFEMGVRDANQLQEWFETYPHLPKVIFCGRSNVGKSSLINSIFGNKTARTSKTAGRTREVNIFTFPLFNAGVIHNPELPFVFLDIPGYGYAEVNPQMRKQWDHLMGVLFSSLSNNCMLVTIQDARHPMQTSDLDFKEFSKKIPCHQILVLNKFDKLKTQKEKAELQKISPKISKEFKHCKEIYKVSAETKFGLNELTQSIIQFLIKNS